jgi:hypothetical protein
MVISGKLASRSCTLALPSDGRVLPNRVRTAVEGFSRCESANTRQHCSYAQGSMVRLMRQQVVNAQNFIARFVGVCWVIRG